MSNPVQSSQNTTQEAAVSTCTEENPKAWKGHAALPIAHSWKVTHWFPYSQDFLWAVTSPWLDGQRQSVRRHKEQDLQCLLDQGSLPMTKSDLQLESPWANCQQTTEGLQASMNERLIQSRILLPVCSLLLCPSNHVTVVLDILLSKDGPQLSPLWSR